MNVGLLRKIDKYFIGLLILIFFRLKFLCTRKQEELKKHPKKILVIRLWALGSSILTFPMIKQLRDHYGDNVQYDLLASSRNIGVFKNQGYFTGMYNIFSIKDIFTLFRKFKSYDIVLDAEEYFMLSAFFSLRLGKINVGYTNILVRGLAYNYGISYDDTHHSLVTALDLIKRIGIQYHMPEYMEPLKYTEKDTIKVNEFLQKFNGTFVCMHTGGAETAKDRARPQEKRIQLITSLLGKYPDTYIFLSGTHFEKEIVQRIVYGLPVHYHKHVLNTCGIFSLFEFAYFLQKCTLMVSNDTGPMHLAAAMGTKTIGIFGPELPRKFGPWPLDKNVGLYKGDGNACIKVHLAIRKKDENYRVDKITVNDVLSHIRL